MNKPHRLVNNIKSLNALNIFRKGSLKTLIFDQNDVKKFVALVSVRSIIAY